MKLLIFIVLVVVLLPLEAQAQVLFTDFEDLTLNASYAVGDSFMSKGLSFDVVAIGGSGFTIYVQNVGSANGSGNELFMNNTVGIDIQLPNGAKQISFLYGEFAGGGDIEINGVLSTPAALVSLDGMTVGGALLSVSSSGAGNDQGMLTATGPITSFVIGGTEFAIDNLRVTVPEPGTYAMLLLGSIPLAALRRRFRRRPRSS